MNNKYCKNCAHFHQHYAFDQRKIFRVYCGHCTQGGVKKKFPDSVACCNFTFAPPDADAFATKEYLSKELLQYILHLELLPQITDTKEDI